MGASEGDKRNSSHDFDRDDAPKPASGTRPAAPAPIGGVTSHVAFLSLDSIIRIGGMGGAGCVSPNSTSKPIAYHFVDADRLLSTAAVSPSGYRLVLDKKQTLGRSHR
jgi:hypothetical protein